MVKNLLRLPPWVTYQGIEFQFYLINTGSELRICYRIANVAQDSPHKQYHDKTGCWLNSLADPDNPPAQGFLVLIENICDDLALYQGAKRCYKWLEERNLLYTNLHTSEPWSNNQQTS